MAKVTADVGKACAVAQTGRERITNPAEWVSVTTGRYWHLPSSLRFFVSFAASYVRLMQPEWMQHAGS
jgi:hypothetical protein